ncbi:hypothetical protein AKJ09_00885 [Labilithrix luteola]|uniref:Polymer-forming cytoskeletal protein n=1 Tax=Labilithrix luteola TaxID=1391654 RepID=A0A0K1PLG0_9BACT|nr:polymer-forming cytoskeletal protein [Labilithrix luteola]AKU94221.1 hypothetical protein AKJ09_00885 [Labilithrix luteola]
MWPFRRPPQSDIPTFSVENTIGTGTTVRGDLKGKSGFRVDGTVDGAVEASGPVVIGEGGTVNGSVEGCDVVVLGCVRGDVTASGHLEIGPKGRIVGDVTTTSFRMHKGGVFRGMSRMPGTEADVVRETRLVAALPPASSTRRSRTLPPPGDGAVPPPPGLRELPPLSGPRSSSEHSASHERLVISQVDEATDAVEEHATGT